VNGILLALAIVLLVALELGVPSRDRFTEARSTTGVPASEPCGDATQLTRPADLLLLEGPDRASWQKPDQIMDELRIGETSVVADIGAGSGWFTMRLARRVPNGLVYAQDVQREMVAAIERRVGRERLENVDTVLGATDSPGLPADASLDAILIVDVYAEIDERVAFLRNLTASLKPQGRIGVVNYKPGAGGPGPCADRRFPASVVEQDARAAGLRVASTMDLRYQYVVVLSQ
jgi:SAM-dependent methyltransferase